MQSNFDPKKTTIVLIDSNALVHRAYHAYPPNLTIPGTGQQVNAVYGFTTLLLEVLNKFNPVYAVCAFDTEKPTVRHTQYVGYKAQRKPTEKELIDQFPIVYDVVNAFNIPLFRIEGFEADDIIGTIAKSEGAKGIQKLIVTGDKDLFQLVNDETFVYMAGSTFSKSMLYNHDEVINKMGFGPEYIVDFKSIKGDPSDNIPGVKGIGDKGALDLIKQFGHLENIYKNLDQVPQKLQSKLIEFHDEAMMSHELATILTDVPLTFKLNEAKLTEYDANEVKELFQKLSFRSLINKLPKSDGDAITLSDSDQSNMFASVSGDKDKHAQPEQPIFEGNKNYKLIIDDNSFKDLITKLTNSGLFAFDVECDSLDYLNSMVVGISFCFERGKAFYITKDILKDKEKVLKLKRIFEDFSIKKLAHNSKFDMHLLKNIGIDVNGHIDDTLIQAYLVEEGEGKLGLKELAFKKLGMVMSTFEDLLGKKIGKGVFDIHSIPESELGDYCCADSDATFQLYEYYCQELDHKRDKLKHLYENIEMPIVKILMEMERAGVRLNREYLMNYNQELQREIAKIQSDIFYLIGHEFNLNSPKQVGDVLFGELNLPGGKKTKNGGFSTNERILKNLINSHEIVPMLLSYRELEKLRSTYTEVLAEKVDANTKRIHANFNQAVTATGRLSSNSPNLQNIPISSEYGVRIRKAFTASDDSLLLGLDIAQQELRVAAVLSKEPKLIDAFKNNQDVHKLTASEIFDKTIDDVTSDERRVGKTLNFSLLYGISAFGLSDRLKVSREEAELMIHKFWSGYPMIRKYFDDLLEDAKLSGYVETYFGRRRNAANLKASNFRIRSAAERELINFPIQGTSADLMKISMIKVDKFIKTNKLILDPMIILQVHDELILEIKKGSDEDIRELAESLKIEMESAAQFEIPLKVEAKLGLDWADLKPIL